MMETKWDRGDIICMFIFTVLFCGVMAFIARDFVRIVMDTWYGFGDVMIEFGSIIEQLPV